MRKVGFSMSFVNEISHIERTKVGFHSPERAESKFFKVFPE